MKQNIPVFLIAVFSCCSFALSAQVQTGEATYYADKFHGLLTAFGEKYDMAKLTAAHPFLDAGTQVRVTNLSNNKSVVVRINDRGPNQQKHPNRIIDLSRAAAAQIDLIQVGRAQVRVEVINNPNPNSTASRSVSTPPATPITTPAVTPPPAQPIPESYDRPIKPTTVAPKQEDLIAKGIPKAGNIPESFNTTAMAPEAVVKEAPVTPAPVAVPATTQKKSAPVFAPVSSEEMPAPSVMGAKQKGFAVQVAAYTHYDDAMAHVVNLKKKWFKDLFVLVKTGSDGISRYVVLMGPFDE
ncbi:MAG: septal ring lytic transglycosylase RlpA family protein, partial [Bacteroidota bacterium]